MNFAEISLAQLNRCNKYDHLYLCEEFMLQIHESSHTCASTIFRDAEYDIIAKHCNFEYVPKSKPPPCILESNGFVLLSNLGIKWSFRYSQENIPNRVSGSNHAVIPRNSFCGCDLVGETYFIPERISDCENNDKM